MLVFVDSSLFELMAKLFAGILEPPVGNRVGVRTRYRVRRLELITL